jgi:molybdopterin molybdotransferase
VDLVLAARLPAGRDAIGLQIKAGETIWLATGAAIPTGVAGVLMEEHVESSSTNHVRVTGRRIEAGANIRRRGEDVAIGTVIVKQGTVFDARHTAILAAVGIAEVRVRRKVRVLVISTGDELIAPPDRAAPFKTYDSNRPMLLALLRSPATEVHNGGLFGDDPIPLSIALQKASETFDLIITSGAAAGSETDRVADAVRQAQGHVLQHHVAIKPGKPLMIGAIGPAIFLGLPGNPVAAYVTARLFALPLIQSMSDEQSSTLAPETVVAGADMRHKSGRTEFAPARIIGTTTDGRKLVVKTGSGGSASLLPLIEADGLVEIDAQRADVSCGQAVTFHPFRAHDMRGTRQTRQSVEASDDLRCH